MTPRLEDRIAVITGGGNGIGRACAERFAEEGAKIVIADILDEAGKETVAALEANGTEALFAHLDAADPQHNEAMAAATLERFGRVDVLVTAAGISHADYVSGDEQADQRMILSMAEGMGKPGFNVVNLDLDKWQKVLDVNLTGTLLAIKACLPHMLTLGGSIVTIASIAAKRPEAGPLSYGVSKAGVWMLTKHLARDLGPANVRVNAIGPGFIATNMTSFLTKNPAIEQMLLPQVPLGKVGQPVDIANAALFLASDESSYFTGEILHPDGGFYTE